MDSPKCNIKKIYYQTSFTPKFLFLGLLFFVFIILNKKQMFSHLFITPSLSPIVATLNNFFLYAFLVITIILKMFTSVTCSNVKQYIESFDMTHVYIS